MRPRGQPGPSPPARKPTRARALCPGLHVSLGPLLPGVVKSALNGQGVAGVTLLFTSGPNLGKTVRGAVG